MIDHQGQRKLESILDVAFASTLVFCALYLSKYLGKSTGQRPNVHLVAWHVVNVILMIAITVILYVYGLKYENADTEQRQAAYYDFFVAGLVSSCTKMYVDLFLLYLLYKFTRPQRKLMDGRTVASAVLFAHDHSKAG